ncbi:PREDICTED: Fc receptor-like protein 3 [Hipposideros armiger]|uniref:Fc receptor-like protein 3 n=1 Tax=Hipposideros armiger TaxID=186990 RepID=A0A8B7QKN7_HIPAR|nr:PREDICTED: Fc receptor-like protein 3 [Hipposideros armiger]XP_019488710.1 PREDICTED: Fc receptor-like protein 3 [Hipposideros armiger]
MLVWLLLTLGAAPKASLLLDPPWSPIFKGQTATLTCKDPHSPAQGYWYHDKEFIKKSEKIQIKKTGCYKCKTDRSSVSDLVCVEFSSGWLVLQAQHPVFEGDDVTLRCQGKDDETIRERNYYKNREKLDGTHNLKSITVRSVSRDSSTYYCTASGKSLLSWTVTSSTLKIPVQELFPPPMLKASPSQPKEGSPVTLTCETRLPPQRSDVQLQFCFFREGQALGSGCSSSPELQIPAMWSEDARSYSCRAQTVTLSVTKRSPWSHIHVQSECLGAALPKPELAQESSTMTSASWDGHQDREGRPAVLAASF